MRRGVDMVMRMMGEQFVTGETIDEALATRGGARSAGISLTRTTCSARPRSPPRDAERYLAAYEQRDRMRSARRRRGRGIYDGPGISIKLSALHPRYCRAQRERVMDELYPRLLDLLAARARDHDIGLNIDAEEADRLEHLARPAGAPVRRAGAGAAGTASAS